MEKVILILIDGMRTDGLLSCGSDYVNVLKEQSTYTLNGKSVFPPVTLPCHVSLFHSVPPQRHGTLTNDFAIPVRPVSGLFETIHGAGKKATMFYSWEKLRDIGTTGCLDAAEFLRIQSFDSVDCRLTDKAISYVNENKPDFVFLYLGETDDIGGHKFGWMSAEYLEFIRVAMDCVKKVVDAVGDEYTVVVTADHGGHDRTHGTEIDEDMIIPMFFRGDKFAENKELPTVSLLDIAPTVAEVMEIKIPDDWEGKSIL